MERPSEDPTVPTPGLWGFVGKSVGKLLEVSGRYFLRKHDLQVPKEYTVTRRMDSLKAGMPQFQKIHRKMLPCKMKWLHRMRTYWRIFQTIKYWSLNGGTSG